MRAHVIENGVVVNTIEVEDLEVFPNLVDAELGGQIGDAWDDEVFTSPSGETLAEKRARIWEDIKVYRDHLVQTGGYKAGAHWYHSDTFSRTQQIALVIMGASIPVGITWKTLDNGYVPMTQSLAGQIFAAAAAQDAALFAKAAYHKAGIDASSDPDSYDWRVDWPETYQGE